jgi:hypothetical protein
MICRNIQKEQGRHNVDAVEVTAKYDVFHYHCIREIKRIFTDNKGTFNVKLAVNYIIDMEYNKHEFVTTSKDILWKCFGHIIIDNINSNSESGITVKERPRMSYNKAMKGEAEIDNKISEQMRKSVVITKADMDFIDEVLQTKKNGTYYSNDMELLFALLCHYKYNKLNNKLKDEYLQITKKKHTTTKQNGRKKKVPIRYNMNAIMNMVGAKSYINSFKRFAESGLVQIEDDKLIRIKMNIEYTDKDEELFTVGDIYNPYVYLVAYKTEKALIKCVICGKDFIKESNNKKTCSKKCSDELHKFRVKENNEKNRPAATQNKKEI